MKHLALGLTAAALIAATPPAGAVGLIVVDEAHWPGHPHPPEVIPPDWPHPHPPPRPVPPPIVIRPHVFSPLQLEQCKADVRIEDQVAVTTLEQEFRNPNAQRMEGTFLFPVPLGAHLDRFSMEIDGKPVEAELLDADKARRIYEDIVRRARDPALLEYDGQAVFKVRIFPIGGHSTRRVTVRYTQVLDKDNGLVGYTLPLNTAKYSSTPIGSLSVKVTLKSATPIKTLYSPTHTVEIRHDGGRRATVGYEGSNLKPDTDLTLYFGTDPDPLGIHLLTFRNGEEDGYFLLLASPGVEVHEDEVMPKDVAFVLDTSGSMAGRKLEQARNALRFCVENLNAEDRFEIIRFSTEADPLFNDLVRPTRTNRDRAIGFVEDLDAIGGTAIDDALGKALTLRTDPRPTTGGGDAAKRPFVIIFLTDGLPTVGVTSEQRILENVKERSDGRVRIFCFGIGTDVNTHLLDRITEHTRATSQYVLPEEDLEVKVSNFYSKIKDPVLANPTLRFQGRPDISKLHPGDLPDVFKGEQLVVAGRYGGHGTGTFILEGSVNGRQRVFEHRVTLPEHDEKHDFIPRLWASRRVGFLLDQIRLHGENGELKGEVTRLARQYGIVTPYTAYLILEDEEHRRVPATVRSLRPLQEDGFTRQQIRQLGRTYGARSSGDLAVNAARANAAFRSSASLADSASSLQEAAEAMAMSPTLVAGPAAGAPGRVAPRATASPPLQQQCQYVGGRNFYLNDGRWVDARVQQLPEARRVRLLFGSEEYFRFAANHRQALPWLAQGSRVAFLLDDVVYEVHE